MVSLLYLRAETIKFELLEGDLEMEVLAKFTGLTTWPVFLSLLAKLL